MQRTLTQNALSISAQGSEQTAQYSIDKMARNVGKFMASCLYLCINLLAMVVKNILNRRCESPQVTNSLCPAVTNAIKSEDHNWPPCMFQVTVLQSPPNLLVGPNYVHCAV